MVQICSLEPHSGHYVGHSHHLLNTHYVSEAFWYLPGHHANCLSIVRMVPIRVTRGTYVHIELTFKHLFHHRLVDRTASLQKTTLEHFSLYFWCYRRLSHRTGSNDLQRRYSLIWKSQMNSSIRSAMRIRRICQEKSSRRTTGGYSSRNVSIAAGALLREQLPLMLADLLNLADYFLSPTWKLHLFNRTRATQPHYYLLYYIKNN